MTVDCVDGTDEADCSKFFFHIEFTKILNIEQTNIRRCQRSPQVSPAKLLGFVDSFYFQYRNCTALNFERYRGAIVVHVLIVHFCCETFVSFINSAISFEGLFFVRQVQF